MSRRDSRNDPWASDDAWARDLAERFEPPQATVQRVIEGALDERAAPPRHGRWFRLAAGAVILGAVSWWVWQRSLGEEPAQATPARATTSPATDPPATDSIPTYSISNRDGVVVVSEGDRLVALISKGPP